jgi:hypothetical protein
VHLDFVGICKLFLSQQEGLALDSSISTSSEIACSGQLANQSFLPACYHFWHLCNKKYGLKAWIISEYRLSLLAKYPRICRFIKGNSAPGIERLLLIIEATAVSSVLQMSDMSRAKYLSDTYFATGSVGVRHMIVEALLINDDFLWEQYLGEASLGNLRDIAFGFVHGRVGSIRALLDPGETLW